MKLVFKTSLVYFAVVAQIFAASAAHGEDHGIPWSALIVPQLINFTIFFVALVFLLRKPVKEFFASKGAEFNSAVTKAAELKQNAEKAHAEIKTRLAGLEKNAETSRKEATKESAELKLRLIKEAQEAAVKAASESEKGIFFEHERAIAALRTELVTNSIKVAQEQVRAGADAAVLSGLQKGFGQKAVSAHRGAQL